MALDRFARFLAGGWLLAAVGTLIANTGVDEEAGDQGGMTEWAMTLVILLVVAVVVYFVVRTRQASSTAALVLGVLALLSFPVFWLGLPALFGVTAIGVATNPDTDKGGKVTAAMVLSALAILAFLVLVLVG